MTNSRIIRNWKAILASLPPLAQVNAEFKTFELGAADAVPDYQRFEFIARNAPDLSLNGNTLERIAASFNYKRGSYFYETDVKLFINGCVEVEMEYGPSGETPATIHYPRFCPTEEELKQCFAPTPTVFMEQWLTDFFTVVGNDPRFVGHFSIGGGGLDKNSETYRNAIPPAEIAAMLLARAKHDKRSATFFEAVFERENTTRDDFIDRITARVKPDRRVFVEYRTYEKESICTHTKNGRPARFSSTSPLVIGVSHEATNLKLTSDIFPHGFAERKPKDFRVRFVNQSENTCRYEDWPNRQQTRQ